MNVRSLRFALTLSVLLLLGMSAVSEVATAGLGGFTAIEGTARATHYQIESHGITLRHGVQHDTEHVCHNACEVSVTVTESGVLAIGPSHKGPLPADATYEFGDFRGRIGITYVGLSDYVVHFDGITRSYRVS